MDALPPLPVIPATIALGLAAHGLRKKSLSPSGAAAAFVVGFLIMAAPLKLFGISLIVFYLSGSRATKVGKTIKRKLEEGYVDAGYRDGWQVLSNSFTALVATSAWSVMFAPASLHHWVAAKLLPDSALQFASAPTFAGDEWCVTDTLIGSGWSRTFIYITLGHFACCLGDTLASELGILSRSPPILITTLRKVPPGTNGAMSLLGTTASVCGGAIMGLTAAICLIFQNSACLLETELPFPVALATVSGPLVIYGALGGFVGSALDSLLGATVQQTRYSIETKRVLQDHAKLEGRQVKVISGINVLSNNQVNVASSILTALLLGWFA